MVLGVAPESRLPHRLGKGDKAQFSTHPLTGAWHVRRRRGGKGHAVELSHMGQTLCQGMLDLFEESSETV